MRLLLDTHVFLWCIIDDPRLPETHRRAIRNPSNEVYLSVASVWEAVIKNSLGKLPLPEVPVDYLRQKRELLQIASLPIDETTLEYLANLPLLHRDPFDRIIISQALQHGLTLVTADHAIDAYSVPRL